MRRHEQRATPHLVLELPHRRIALSSLFLLSVYCSTALVSCLCFLSFQLVCHLFFYPVRMLTTEPLTSTDDKILVQMGSVREGQTEEEKETYLAGLKEIINDLRRDKVKDFDTVASEIAAYRRRFLQDPSRVLSL